ncbi:phospholipase D-like domain-containing protein [Brevundimonas poindexterae]|uniref:phospholipase D-like domain-containing protein n=1 Tax=Brevundimonas poindexterae TaxID=74325 RepID=UPI001CFDD26B|nr:phospholipase D-like domain-containing protein [Brevundimonas poindexterae]
MKSDSLVSPSATARFVVTLPPEPSKLADALRADIAARFSSLTDTTDAFRYLATLAKDRLVIMVPYIDTVGAQWALELFELTDAHERLLVLRDATQLRSCGLAGQRVADLATIHDYAPQGREDGESDETFHAKIVLADGVAAYVGSANLLRRSKGVNLECGMLVEGAAVRSIKVVVDAVISTFSGS